jgi:hypothetical protein
MQEGHRFLFPHPSCNVLQGRVLVPFAVSDGRASRSARSISIGHTNVQCSCHRSSSTIVHHGGPCNEYATCPTSQSLSASRGAETYVSFCLLSRSENRFGEAALRGQFSDPKHPFTWSNSPIAPARHSEPRSEHRGP